jgi:hypothetical protein
MNEKEPKQAGALAIRHIAILEQANTVLLDLTDEVWKAINEVCLDVVAAKDWDGDFEDSDPQWLAPKDWRVAGTEHEESSARVTLSFDGGADEFAVTTLCGAGAGRSGFCWEFEYKNLTGKVAWKRFAVGVNQRYALREKFGFEYKSDDGQWFLPFKLDPELLATAYETDDWALALKPVSDALEKVETALPTFTAIIMEAKAAFKPT